MHVFFTQSSFARFREQKLKEKLKAMGGVKEDFTDDKGVERNP